MNNSLNYLGSKILESKSIKSKYFNFKSFNKRLKKINFLSDKIYGTSNKLYR